MSEEKTKPNETSNSACCVRLLLFTIFSSVPMISYGMVCLNLATPVMREMYNESYMDRRGIPMSTQQWNSLRSLTVRIFLIGAFFGCFLVKAFLSCLTRKKCLLAAHYINVIGGAITCTTAGLTRAYEPIIIGRFITGIGSGMSFVLVLIIVAEICVKARQQVYNSLIGVALAVGTLLGMFFGWTKVFGTPQLWPLIPLLPALPSLMYILISVPETPYQVLKSGNRSQLRLMMRKLRDGSADAVDSEIREMVEEEESKSKELLDLDCDITPNRSYRDITLKEAVGIIQYRRQFFTVTSLLAGFALSGYSCVITYCETMLVEAGFDGVSTSGVVLCLLTFQVIATLPGAFLLPRIGSWVLLISGCLITILGQILIVISVALTPDQSWLAALGIGVFLLGSAGCTTIAIFPLISEVTTLQTRAVSLNSGSAIFWLISWLVAFSSAYFQNWWGANSLLIWTAFTIVFTVYVMVLVPNTKKISAAREELERQRTDAA